MSELVHYKIGDNAWVVEGDKDFLRKHLNFGFFEDESGRIICTDPSMLYMCGREIQKRRFFGRRSSEEVTMGDSWKKMMKMIRQQKLPIGCPHDKSICRFWNNAFFVCGAGTKQKDVCPCLRPLEESISKDLEP